MVVKIKANRTKIEWATHTLNIATGCSRVSPGCDNCYMYRQYPRLRAMHVNGYDVDPDTVRLIRDRIAEIAKLARSTKKVRVFLNSMSDSFHKDVPFELMRDVVQEFARYPNVVGMLLTKRPGRMAYFSEKILHDDWPANVWALTSIESVKYRRRLDLLRRVAAPTRGISAEPLLSPLGTLYEYQDTIDWVIVGGESGPKARPMARPWVDYLQRWCVEHRKAFFFKQWGAFVPMADAPGALKDSYVKPTYYGEPGRWLAYGYKTTKGLAGKTLWGRTWTQFPDDPEFAK